MVLEVVELVEQDNQHKDYLHKKEAMEDQVVSILYQELLYFMAVAVAAEIMPARQADLEGLPLEVLEVMEAQLVVRLLRQTEEVVAEAQAQDLVVMEVQEF
jgi:hypothetical protein